MSSAKEPVASLGEYLSDLEATLKDLAQQNIVKRIWQKDHTVWESAPTEISNRLGWLTAPEYMSEKTPDLQSFAQEVKESAFCHVVLLGMGGSSLGAEVLRKTCGNAKGYPEFILLDSTLPSSILAVTETIDPAHTLFIVSSKSGDTTESLVLFRYFQRLVEQRLGKGKAGQNFIAITDPESPLSSLAEQENFRQIFLNPPDIGGRFSVLSYFGLVPAALTGINIKKILMRANKMRATCTSIYENPGAWLGACMGTLTIRGRDKLTLITSPSISNFGLWVEQLISESLGKEGKGIIPILGEPLIEPSDYSCDRFFICLRLHGDDNSTIDSVINRIKTSGQPTLVLEMYDKYDLGAELFRWEYAVAVAGAIIGIHPFDQPNVQSAKDATKQALQDYTTSGYLPQIKTGSSLVDLLTKAEKGEYFAITAYLRQTPELDNVFTKIRRQVLDRFHIATTVGYGPRYLHSTGQLHKGGPNTGLYLQITANHEKDISIPGQPYTFGVVADAQALGDLRALQSMGRRVVKVHLSQPDPAAIEADVRVA